MNPNQDPQAALASLLAILSRSTQNQALQTPSTSHSHLQQSQLQNPPSVNTPLPLEHLEPVFADDAILETTQWIGVPTTQWYEPRMWQLPPRGHISTTQRAPHLANVKRKRSVSPVEPTKQSTSLAIAEVTTFPTYSHALKHIIRQSETKEFMDAIREMKKRQDDLESDLFEERTRITQKWESKRKVNQVLQSLGSQNTSEDTIHAQEIAELKSFDLDVVKKWNDLICTQTEDLRELGVPYFAKDVVNETENRGKILAFLEDLISGEHH